MAEDSFILNDEATDPPKGITTTGKIVFDIPSGLKAGWRTTEFWITLAILAIAAFVSWGVITNDQASAIEKIIGTILALIGAGATGTKYMSLRTSLKQGQQ